METDLLELCKFPVDQNWKLLYRGSEHKFDVNEFHAKCNKKRPTLTIIKSEGGFVFGGYTAVQWNSRHLFKYDPYAFIFSLVNKENRPIKINVENNHDMAILCSKRYGPAFGYKARELCVFSTKDSLRVGESNLGYYFKHPSFDFDSEEAKTFLAGTHQFRVQEIEVFMQI